MALAYMCTKVRIEKYLTASNLYSQPQGFRPVRAAWRLGGATLLKLTKCGVGAKDARAITTYVCMIVAAYFNAGRCGVG